MKKKIKQHRAVFRTRIDFKYNEPSQNSLLPGGTYYLEKGSNERVSYDDIVNEAVWIINNDLKSNYRNIPLYQLKMYRFMLYTKAA